MFAVIGAGCASAPKPAINPSLAPLTAAAEDLDAAHASYRAEGLDRRRVEPDAYWEQVLDLVETDPERFRVAEVGSSIEGRPIYRIDFGRGATTVLLWSQMHGNESTATRALVDLLSMLIAVPDDPRVRRIEEALAVTFVPMLNPDGAARFVRHNAVGIDVNRDARRLATPEGRALKAVRDDIEAQWGFNLHDQNVRTRLGRSADDVQIALLAPPPGAGTTNEANQSAKHLAAVIAHALRPVVGAAIARYSETFNPRAFGDLMTRWGTATVLIESGGSIDDPDKELPRRANFVALMSALDAIATGGWRNFDQAAYTELPGNGPAFVDLLIAGAYIALPGREPVRADVSVRYADSLDRSDGVVVEVGDLAGLEALETVVATGLYLVPGAAGDDAEGEPALLPGDILDGVISRDREGREVVWRLEAGRPIAVGGR